MPYVDDKNYEGEQSPSNFMKLQQGENRIRIASKTFNFKKHNFKTDGKFSSKICQGEDCEYCASNPAKNRYAWIVIDRADGGIKILETGWQIYGQLLSYAKDEDYGDLENYDVKIKKSGELLETEYNVVAVPKPSEITEKEREAIANSNIDLEKIFTGKFAKKEVPDEPPVESYEKDAKEEIDLNEMPF